MGKFTKDLLKVFGMAAKDASPEELENMANATMVAFDAAPAAEEKTADVMVERAPKGDDLGTKLDRLIEMMGELMKKNDREEKKLSDESDLDQEIARLSGARKEGEDEKETVVIPAEKTGGDASVTADAAQAALLKRVRPAVAAITDEEQRARVVDALLSTMQTADTMDRIMAATKDAAKASASARKDPETIINDQQAAYDKWNPHKKA